MTNQLTLTAVCAIPGCTTPVVESGFAVVCDGCVHDFGDMLRPGAVPVTSDEIETRDRETAAAYAAQLRQEVPVATRNR